MTREEIDTLWQGALQQAIKDGEEFTRYHFAALVAAAEREACAKVCEDQDTGQDLPYDLAVIECAAAIRARGEK